MQKECRAVVYDEVLRIEAYRFEGIAQPFPNHFHEYYVIGFIENGQRVLSCRNSEYYVQSGDILLFNPGDSHACTQNDGGTLDYRGINIPKETMLSLAEEITGKAELPGFSPNVIRSEEIRCCLRPLHEQIMQGGCEFGREESLLVLLAMLIQQYGRPFETCIPECPDEIEKACAFMAQHAAEHLSLAQICRHVGLSRSTLIRAFTRTKGVTPYSYLENIRIGRAKKLLEQGLPPVETALQTGFADQSHFTRNFSRFIGLAPGTYQDIFAQAEKAEDTPYEK